MSRFLFHRASAGALAALLLAACGSEEPKHHSSRHDAKDAKMMASPESAPKRARMSAYDPQIVENARAMLADGREIFRRDTFGDEAFWGDTLQLHRAIESSVSPKTALAVGLKVDSEALDDGTTSMDGIVNGGLAVTPVIASADSIQKATCALKATYTTAYQPGDVCYFFALLEHEFSIERGELTPSMKVKRKVIDRQYKDVIDKLYEEPVRSGAGAA